MNLNIKALWSVIKFWLMIFLGLVGIVMLGKLMDRNSLWSLIVILPLFYLASRSIYKQSIEDQNPKPNHNQEDFLESNKNEN